MRPARDLHQWSRVGDGLALDIDGRYEEYTPGHWHDRAMRDPWVMRDPSGDGWLMYFTGRSPGARGAERRRRDRLRHFAGPQRPGRCRSRSTPAATSGRLRCRRSSRRAGAGTACSAPTPEHYARVYAASYPGAPVRGTHYLVAEDPRGPWTVAPGPFLDGDPAVDRYAARIVDTGEGLVLLGFRHNPGGGAFVGEIADPVPVTIDRDGRLQLG